MARVLSNSELIKIAVVLESIDINRKFEAAGSPLFCFVIMLTHDSRSYDHCFYLDENPVSIKISSPLSTLHSHCKLNERKKAPLESSERKKLALYI